VKRCAPRLISCSKVWHTHALAPRQFLAEALPLAAKGEQVRNKAGLGNGDPARTAATAGSAAGNSIGGSESTTGSIASIALGGVPLSSGEALSVGP